MARLKELYKEKIIPELMNQLKLKNPMQVPRIQKIVVNIGVSEAKDNIKFLDESRQEMSMITGQKPIITRVKMSISNFKIRKGMPIGCKVTLHGTRMYEFLDRLINVALPRIRDFRGLSLKGFDNKGNYTMGIQEHVIFPEIDVNKTSKMRGFNVTIVTSSKNDDQARELLVLFGMPFSKTEI